MHSGPRWIIECARFSTVIVWLWIAEQTCAKHHGVKDSIEKRSNLSERRRSVAFANRFTFGDEFRLLGNFAMYFNTPSAPDY